MRRLALCLLGVFIALGGWSAVSADDALVAYWSFDDIHNGIVPDASANANDGSIVTPLMVASEGCVTGKCLDFSYEFQTSNTGYVVVPSSDSLGALVDELRIEFWVKRGGDELDGLVLQKRVPFATTEGLVHFGVKLRPDHGIQFIHGTENGPYPSYSAVIPLTSAAPLLNDGAWHFIAITHRWGETDDTTISIDGQQLNVYRYWSGADYLPPTALDADLWIGRQPSLSPGIFNGWLDEVKIFNRLEGGDPTPTTPDLATGLVAYYPLNGNGDDLSGNGLHGIPYEAYPTPDRLAEPYSAMNFVKNADDELTGRIEVAHSPLLQLTQLSLSAWVRTDPTTSETYVVAKGDERPYHLGTKDGAFRFTVGNPVNHLNLLSTTLPDGQWHHLAGTYNGTESRFYVDGVLENSGTFTEPMAVDENPLNIGRRPVRFVHSGFDGDIDEVRIYDRALTPAEVAILAGVSCPDAFVEVSVYIPVPGATVDIRYGDQGLIDGDTFLAAPDSTIQWRVNVNGFSGPWQTYSPICANPVLVAADSAAAQVTIVNPVPGGTIDLRYGPQDLLDGDTVDLPIGTTVQWRLSVNGFDGPWGSFTVDGDGALEVTGSHFCALTIVNPIPDSHVDVRYGPQDLADGAVVYLPRGISIQWRLFVNGFNGAWTTFAVDGTCILEVSGDAFCDLTISNPVPGSHVDIRYGAQDLLNGAVVTLPRGIAIQWRLNATGFDGPWLTHTADGSCLLQVTTDHYVDLAIANPVPGSHVDVRYGPQDLLDGDIVTLPRGITIQWLLNASGYNGPWTSLSTAGTTVLEITESHYCMLEIDIPANAEVDLRYGPQDLLDGDTVPLPIGIVIEWRITIDGVIGEWTAFTTGGDGCTMSYDTREWVGVARHVDDGTTSHWPVTIDLESGLVFDNACSTTGTILSDGTEHLVVDFPGCGELTADCEESNDTLVCTGTTIASSDGRSITTEYWLTVYPTH